MREGKADEANTALDKALETAGISGDEIQQAEVFKARLAFMQHNDEQGIAHLKKALEAAPKGELVPMIQAMLRQIDKPKKPVAKKPVDE